MMPRRTVLAFSLRQGIRPMPFHLIACDGVGFTQGEVSVFAGTQHWTNEEDDAVGDAAACPVYVRVRRAIDCEHGTLRDDDNCENDE
jgi:hypothetical protein